MSALPWLLAAAWVAFYVWAFWMMQAADDVRREQENEWDLLSDEYRHFVAERRRRRRRNE